MECAFRLRRVRLSRQLQTSAEAANISSRFYSVSHCLGMTGRNQYSTGTVVCLFGSNRRSLCTQSMLKKSFARLRDLFSSRMALFCYGVICHVG